MTLLAFPAERGRARACMRYRSIAGTRRRRPQLSIDRPISCPGWLSSKPAGRRWSMSRPTDGRTDTQPLHRPCSAQYAGSVNNQLISTHHLDWPSTPSDNLWKLIYLATEALSDSVEFIGAIEISLSIYLSISQVRWLSDLEQFNWFECASGNSGLRTTFVHCKPAVSFACGKKFMII